MLILMFALFFGALIGKIKFFGARLGLSGVLLASMIIGFFLSNYTVLLDENFLVACENMTMFGRSLFIAVIGLNAGKHFIATDTKKSCKAFLGGVCIVLIGIASYLLVSLFGSGFSQDLMLGLFSGSMTSTPAMAAAQEYFGIESKVAVGYGISYCIGLFSIVLFTQFVPLPYNNNDLLISAKESSGATNPVNAIVILSGTVMLGYVFSYLIPLGRIFGILLSGLIIGAFFEKKNYILSEFCSYKTLGLVLFFAGSGFSAGAELKGCLNAGGFAVALLISLSAIVVGYYLLYYVFRFSKTDVLSILCGGMTSTPAIGLLSQRTKRTDLSIYALSYVGALITLLIFIRMMLLYCT